MKIRNTDKIFSQYIRNRDNWKCQRCLKNYENNKQGLHCSHYWGRGRENTRFDPKNCLALCFGCHRLWGHGDLRDEYTSYMERKLGKEEFENLKIRAFQYKKKDDKLVMIWLTNLIAKDAEKQGVC